MAQPLSVYERYGTPNLPGSDAIARHRIARADDTLPIIAAQEFATGYDSELWRQIAEANNVTDIDASLVGIALIIPTPLPSST